jgi:hypothetical protein
MINLYLLEQSTEIQSLGHLRHGNYQAGRGVDWG